MAVTKPWVGSSAKAETGMAWMGDARVALRLPRAGWMSEMVGRSKEIRFVNNTNRTQANIYALMGSPKEVTTYIFENNATISAATQGGWALQTGAFPAGSTLTIINRGFIRGGGGNGGHSTTHGGNVGLKGGDAIVLNFPTHINNSQGYIYGGGGGGGCTGYIAGGGGAGTPAGLGGRSFTKNHGSDGTSTSGGAGGVSGGSRGGAGGALGAVGGIGNTGATFAGGAAGRAVALNGHSLTWLGGNDSTRVKGPVV